MSCVGLQFEAIAADGVASIADLKVTDVAPGLWETMATDAPCIMIYNGSTYDYYYYISDAGDNYDETGWADGDGMIVTEMPLVGTGVWLRIPEACATTGSLTEAGQVLGEDSATIEINIGLTLAANPYPVALDMSKVTTTGLTAGLWETMATDAPCIMIYNGSTYDYYYYISDAGDNYDETGWADGDGMLVNQIANVGEAFWIRSTEAGMLTFTK